MTGRSDCTGQECVGSCGAISTRSEPCIDFLAPPDEEAAYMFKPAHPSESNLSMDGSLNELDSIDLPVFVPDQSASDRHTSSPLRSSCYDIDFIAVASPVETHPVEPDNIKIPQGWLKQKVNDEVVSLFLMTHTQERNLFLQKSVNINIVKREAIFQVDRVHLTPVKSFKDLHDLQEVIDFFHASMLCGGVVDTQFKNIPHTKSGYVSYGVWRSHK